MKENMHSHDNSLPTIQRGQAIVLIALGFIMLLAFTGLVVDVARVFVMRGELRRAVDAAGLAATSQFRQGATPQKITNAANDLFVTHGLSATVVVQTCNLGPNTNPALCPPAGKPMRKLVRVEATAHVPMLFLQIVGIPSVDVSGENISEAASVEAVLVLDNSESQSYNFAGMPEPFATQYASCNQSNVNDIYTCLNGGTLTNGVTVNGCNNEIIPDPNPAFPLLTRGVCQPFRKTKEAAYAFIKRLYPGYDRVAIINFNENGHELVPLTGDLEGNSGSAINLINNMDVYVSPGQSSQPNPTGHILCNASVANTPDAWKCGSSNISEGLIYANNVFGNTSNPPRQDALWVTLLLVDGAANRAPLNNALAWSDAQYGVCPLSERSTPLKCRDADSNSRHKPDDVGANFGLYDADDYARDAGDQLGLDPLKFASPLPGGKPAGVLIYTIALGKNSVCSNGSYTAPNGGPAICTGSNPVYGDPDAAEQLLRYIADIGDDGNPTTGPCLDQAAPYRDATTKWDPSGRSDDAGLGMQCGNYYFAPDANELERIFLEIAGRIFTRISG